MTTRTIMAALCVTFVAALVMGCVGADAESGTDRADAEDVAQASDAVISCESGWHYHYTTWPATGFYASPCGFKITSVPAGTPVCMRSVASTVCNGQGYSLVHDVWGLQYWARTEAFNGH